VHSDQLVTVLSAASFLFVGVGSNRFRYVLDFEVTVQGLIGDVPGALLIILSICDWNIWRILVLDGLLHHHSSNPYSQMGRSIALYTVSLLSRDSCERAFINQLMFLRLKFQLASFSFYLRLPR